MLSTASGRPARSRTGADTPYSEASSSPAQTPYPRALVAASSSASTPRVGDRGAGERRQRAAQHPPHLLGRQEREQRLAGRRGVHRHRTTQPARGHHHGGRSPRRRRSARPPRARPATRSPRSCALVRSSTGRAAATSASGPAALPSSTTVSPIEFRPVASSTRDQAADLQRLQQPPGRRPVQPAGAGQRGGGRRGRRRRGQREQQVEPRGPPTGSERTPPRAAAAGWPPCLPDHLLTHRVGVSSFTSFRRSSHHATTTTLWILPGPGDAPAVPP